MNKLLLSCFLLLPVFAGAAPQADGGRSILPLSGPGWFLLRDEQASWKDDTLYLPDEAKDLSKLPVNPPTGGWSALDPAKALPVSVPGTVEEYLTRSDKPTPNDFLGVSWWFRSFEPPQGIEDKRILLRFESVRMRAEVYIDGHLAAYDLIGETPFEADVTELLRAPGKHVLAVRVTNPGGNFHWQDFNAISWGKYRLPPGRSFSGILGRINLLAVDPVYIEDLYIQNTTDAHKVNAIVTVHNATNTPATRDLSFQVSERKDCASTLAEKKISGAALPPGDTTLTLPVEASSASLWELPHPVLYSGSASLSEKGAIRDRDEKAFGFRWFSPEGIGTDAVLRLNGRRIVLRSAISWGYWPVTGLYPTPAMALKQVRTAKELGLNMLNFHRNIGSPIVLETADEQGLLYYEEPGGFHSVDHDPFIRAVMQEKVRRMVMRDRSHPSLVIYNMINEFGGKLSKDAPLTAQRMEDMRTAHAIDPSRTMTYTSGWAGKKETEEDSKAHFRPFDDNLYRKGWFDNHRAGGPETWKQDYYKSPTDNYMFTDDREEIFMRGEEGALSTPPRLAKIIAARKDGLPGWDGLFWKNQYTAFERFLDEKKLRSAFPTVDALTEAMGNISFEHQGRRIELARAENVQDCYVVNGWESMPYDNHSGIVDIDRNSKGDPAILAYYNQSSYVAVVPRTQVLRLPNEARIDFYAVNETGLVGPHTLRIVLVDPSGKKIGQKDLPISLTGGETYGQLLAEDVRLPLGTVEGTYSIQASILNSTGKEVSKGHDRICAVSWNSDDFAGTGAVYEPGAADGKVALFFKKETGRDLPAFDGKQGPLDWLVVARPPLDDPRSIEAEAFRTADGKPGLDATFYKDSDIQQAAGKRRDAKLDFEFAEGAQADTSVAANQAFSAIWEGTLVPSVTGQYLIGAETNGGIRISVDGQRLVDDWGNHAPSKPRRAVTLTAGKPVTLRVEYSQNGKQGFIRLQWSPPGTAALDPQLVLDRAEKDGTTVLILDGADSWMNLIAKRTALKEHGSFPVGKNWVGGVQFVRDHPLFRGLPVNCGMDWPYQALVQDGERRLALRTEGEELVAGAYRSHGFDLGTCVGIIPCGKGRIVFSTLDVVSNLTAPVGPADAARKFFCNTLDYARQNRSSR